MAAGALGSRPNTTRGLATAGDNAPLYFDSDSTALSATPSMSKWAAIWEAVVMQVVSGRGCACYTCLWCRVIERWQQYNGIGGLQLVLLHVVFCTFL